MAKTRSTKSKAATTATRDRKGELRARYGVEFPDELFAVWELARSMNPKDPRGAFWIEPFNMALCGPFDVLAGRFDKKEPKLPALLHWRYVFDPPEFFTVASGDSDGLHWGYWFDDGTSPQWVASYYSNDAYEIEPRGRTLVEAMRMHLEASLAGTEDNFEDEPDEKEAYEEMFEAIADLRSKLITLGTGDRPETGEKYTRKYNGRKARKKETVAPTLDGMGIVAPKKAFAPVSVDDKEMSDAIKGARSRAKLIGEAERAIAEGRPAKALAIAKELWVRGTQPEIEQASYPLLIAAYEALGRPALAEVVRVHSKNRRLRSVDIFDAK